MADTIRSGSNTLFKQLLKLGQSGKARREARLTVLDGEHLLEMAWQSGVTLERLLLAESASQVLGQKWQQRCPSTAVSVFSDTLFRQFSPVDSPSGIAALLTLPEGNTPRRSETRRSESFWVMLEAVQDPGNVGAILRTAAAAGVSDVWLSAGCADVWSPKVLRAAMGAHFSLALHDGADLPALASGFNGHRLAAVLEQSMSLYELDLTGPCCFMIGNEGAGLSAELTAQATSRIRIPMPGMMESLNAAVAAGVCLFERVRQTERIKS